jgi:hypothetical protein
MEKRKRLLMIGLAVAGVTAILFVFWTTGSKSINEAPKDVADSRAIIPVTTPPANVSDSSRDSVGTVTKPAAKPNPATALHQPQQASTPVVGRPPRPPPVDPKEPALGFGQTVTANVEVANQSYDLTPNQVGRFQRVSLKPSAQVPVTIAYPEGEPNQAVVLEAKDGGQFDNGAIVKIAKLDAQKKLSFTFQADGAPGIYQVSLRNGADEKVLDFWVGPEREVAGQANK